MDPLSVAASVTGLAGAAAKITKTLQVLAGADRLAKSVAVETEALVAVFSQLNGYLRLCGSDSDSKQRMSMTTVEQFVTIVTHAVFTFAELEEELDGLEIGGDPVGWDRVRWAAKSDTLKEILADLQQQKLSLNLMIGIWTCKTNLEARNSYEQLCKAVEALQKREAASSSNRRPSTARISSDSIINTTNTSDRPRSSRMRRFSRSSRTTTTTPRSLKTMSLDQVDDMLALSLPICTADIYNGDRYRTSTATTTPIQQPQPQSPRPKSMMLQRVATFGGRFSTPVVKPQRSLLRRMTAWWTGSPIIQEEEPGFEISGPFDCKHTTHIGVDPITGKMRIVGEESPETAVARANGWMA